jgi:hypothetical protein
MADLDFSQFKDADKGFPPEEEVASLLDKKFGRGKWHFGSKFRPPEREDELRAEGAGTVPKGDVSQHSMGTPERPGAWDLTVLGMSPQDVALKLQGTKLDSGATLATDFPEAPHGQEPAHTHISFTPEKIQPVKLADAGEDNPPPPLDFSQFEKPVAKPKPPPKRGGAQGVQEAKEGVGNIASDVKTAYAPGDAPQPYKKQVLPADAPVTDRALAWFEDLGGAAPPKYQTDPVKAGAADRISGDILGAPNNALKGFLHGALGVNPADVDAAEMAAGYLLGGPKTGAANLPARVGAKATSAIAEAATPNALRASTQALRSAPHTQDVKMLHDAGIRMSPGQIQGGLERDLESKRSSDPLQGHAIHERVRQSMEDYNRALYRKTLGEIGEDYPKDGPVGHDGVEAVRSRLNQGYEKIKPELNAKMDEDFTKGIDDARHMAGVKGSREQQEFDSILDRRIKPAFGKDGLTGQGFKDLESFLSKEVKGYKNSPDAYQRKLGDALEDVQSELRGSLERHSAPQVRDQLKKLNTAWASYKTIEDAAYGARAADGRFTPRQFMTSLGKGGRLQRAMVARGKAKFQDLTRAAQRVLPDKVPDSGTAGRNLANRGHARSIGAALGGMAGAGLGLHGGGLPGIIEGGGIGSVVGGMAGGMVDRAIAPTANNLARARLESLAQKQLARRGLAQRQQPNMLRQITQPPIQQGPTP